jgi:putative transposase
MASTYLDLTCHVIYATKFRQPWTADPWRARLHAYMGGTIRGLGATPIAIGITADHVHLLIGLRGTHAVANVVRDVKTASSLWIKETASLPPFAWQDGYAALSVSSDRKNTIVSYIANQEDHHRTWSSKDELESILNEAGIAFDRKYFE